MHFKYLDFNTNKTDKINLENSFGTIWGRSMIGNSFEVSKFTHESKFVRRTSFNKII